MSLKCMQERPNCLFSWKKGPILIFANLFGFYGNKKGDSVLWYKVVSECYDSHTGMVRFFYKFVNKKKAG